MKKDLMRVEEVAVVLGVSVKTVNNWYAFKKENPDNEFARMLPEFIQEGPRQTRYWNRFEMWKLIEFQSRIPKGRNGVLGCVTQKYYKKEKQNEKKKQRKKSKKE